MEKSREIITLNFDDTKRLGRIFGEKIFVKGVITLEGELGAGKTTFSQGFAKGLGINDVINSPTFNIIKCHFKGRLPFYHIDAYRLEDVHQDLGFEEYIDGDGVCLIEWPMFIEDELPEERIHIYISQIEESSRKIKITGTGEKNIKLLEEVLELWDMN